VVISSAEVGQWLG